MRPEAELWYLDGPGGPLATILHRSPASREAQAGILLCPPFGWDEVCSYRTRRAWADQLAVEGFPCARISYSGTGDSGGSPRDGGRLEAWTQEVALAARWLRAQTGAKRVVAVGIELGGLLAHRASANHADIDDLVLWSTPGSGRSLIRQLRAFSRLQRVQFFAGLPEPPPLPPGDLEAGGFLLTAETVRALDALTLPALTLPNAAERRVLLLERDGMAVDSELREQLVASGAEVTVARGPGYADMCSHPQHSEVPATAICEVRRWLEAQRGGARVTPAPGAAPKGSRSARIPLCSGDHATESSFEIGRPGERVIGILGQPSGKEVADLCVVLLNAGAVRRAGPNRMWVEAARRWNGYGVTTLRLDVQGIGDSDGGDSPYAADASLYTPELVGQVLASLDVLRERGVAQRFVLVGLCAGAYWSFQAALSRADVVGALMVNPRALIWSSTLGPARDLRTILTERVTLDRLRRVVTVPRLRALVAWMLSAPAHRLRARFQSGTSGLDIDAALDQAIAGGKQMLLLFADDEDLYDELERSGRKRRLEASANVRFESIAVRDHTLRPIWAQQQAHRILDEALERELQTSRGAAHVEQAIG